MSLKVIDTFQADFCAARLKALGEPIRLRIIDLLRGGEMTVTDLATALETAIVTASHHLQILKHLELVVARREGKFIYYGLPKELLQKRGKSRQLLNLGCCLIEVPVDGAPTASASPSE